MSPLARVAHLGELKDSIARFVVDQHYDAYSATDQDTWVRIINHLLPFWNECAHPDFLDGLGKTGISLDKIPNINHINDCLTRFGWGAVTVDGYIAPDVFMGLQSQCIIPVARDIRKPENLDYTPAPDIVHEAAAHVPLLINPEYGRIVQRFGELSLKAGFDEYDETVYEAVRTLSNIKENPNTHPDEIDKAERELATIMAQGGGKESSPGKQLTRLYWWTIEYGLIGDDADLLKVYGAGLLSSVSEGAAAMQGGAELVPLDEAAFHMDFDITQPQPQLYVAPTFGHINTLLDEFATRYHLN